MLFLENRNALSIDFRDSREQEKRKRLNFPDIFGD